MPAAKLRAALKNIRPLSDPNLLVGFDTSDDGAVYRLADGLAIIQTLDFFPPMVDDPFTFGQIAAANALSDIWAMGGEVKIALNIVSYPDEEDAEGLHEILRGGAQMVNEAGGVLCGGHSISGEEILYGLSVTGTADPKKIYRNDSCVWGDRLILTKPIGTGILTSAYAKDKQDGEGYAAAVKSMTTLNKRAAEIIKRHEVNACTDVTGFSLLGHMHEMAGDNSTIIVDAAGVPLLPDAYERAKEGAETGGGKRNKKYMADKMDAGAVDETLLSILCDPQTSGGLLVSVPEACAQSCLSELTAAGIGAAIVAEVAKRGAVPIILK